jgi:hypothetical protein
MLMLAPANPPPTTSGTGAGAPTGSFWYKMVTASEQGGPSFEWFVRAQHLTPKRAFRVEFAVDDRASYAVGSARADRFGVLAAHGTLSRFADQYCVGEPAEALPISGRHVVAVSVKADGARNGGASGGVLTDPERSLGCDGNGDGVFEYWLISRGAIDLKGQPTEAAP